MLEIGIKIMAKITISTEQLIEILKDIKERAERRLYSEANLVYKYSIDTIIKILEEIE